MTVRNIGNLVDDAVALQSALDYIQFNTSDRDATANLVKLRALLATDSTAYNIDALEEFVNEKGEAILVEHKELAIELGDLDELDEQ